ncbi:hypothetical protein TNIN_76331 [Trichonephila inaurata madagascariensis]|uniref:Uncharacterized protein n=1 Tax=Trichonephila inaurata madagascariensis TaxID=2747483 RepID=A0A8X7CKZ7_9ARAC|nr:hypothetical protein TNIN_76331 [Trichonephila inaurata madagascariensis]
MTASFPAILINHHPDSINESESPQPVYPNRQDCKKKRLAPPLPRSPPPWNFSIQSSSVNAQCSEEIELRRKRIFYSFTPDTSVLLLLFYIVRALHSRFILALPLASFQDELQRGFKNLLESLAEWIFDRNV